LDETGRIRVDDWEMDPEVQAEIARIWPSINSANLRECSDFEGYQANFLNLFGFGLPGIDYEAEAEVDLPLPSAG
jgi:enoyl-[acyl-carrier protein] reductase/trans-2-enoyl-CoA reductase (NAD+)